MDVLSPDIRRSAFDKLAAVAVEAPVPDEGSDITRLAEQSQCHRKHRNEPAGGAVKDLALKSQVPMSIRELDVLLALCKASRFVNSLGHASKLVSQLSLYLPNSHSQFFHLSPFLHRIRPSPWETLTYNLLHALLLLGLKYPSLRKTIIDTVNDYLRSCAETIASVSSFHRRDYELERHDALQESTGILSITVSLVGFFEASAKYVSFWDASEKLQLAELMRQVLSETFMVDIETASSTIRNSSVAENVFRDWRKYARRYAAHGRPLGAMLLQQGFMRFIKACAASLAGSQKFSEDEFLDGYAGGVGIARSSSDSETALAGHITKIATDQIRLLDDGSDYLRLGSLWQQRLTFSVKALCLVSFLNCVILGEDVASSDVLLNWLEDTLMDPNQMASTEIAMTVLKGIVVVARLSPNTASSGSRSLLRFLVRGSPLTGSVIAVASQCLAQVLSILSQDAVITTLYSLGNVLSSGSSTDNPYQSQLAADAQTSNTLSSYTQLRDTSMVSLAVNGEEDNAIQRSVIHAIVIIATNCNDDKITALTQSMLLQKIGKMNMAVDAYIIQETAVLALCNGQSEFQLLLKFYSRALHDALIGGHNIISDAVQTAMIYLSVRLTRESPRYKIYLVHLLENIVNKGNATDLETDRQGEVFLTRGNISPFLKPLALLVSSSESEGTGNFPVIPNYDDDVLSMFRDVWFNIAVHGISLNSNVAQTHMQELRMLAEHSPPLVAEDRMEVLESDVELNTILRRGMTPHRLVEQKKNLITELPGCESDIKRLNYPKVVFFNADLLVESLRASAGDCTKVLNYFLDPALTTTETASCMNAIADKVVSRYLQMTLSGKCGQFSAPYLSKQLACFFAACCHRIERVQNVARICANKIITECPSALCERHSLFCLLELLTVMWSSCLEGELDEFDWKSSFVSPRGIVTVDLPDDYNFRRKTLELLYEQAEAWVKKVMDTAPLDIKGLLQTYLSEFEDDGACGNISMGRSFALRMGSLIPQSDQRLASIDSHGSNAVNAASGFIAQYTSRQKYPYLEKPSASDKEHDELRSNGRETTAHFADAVMDVENILSRLYEQTIKGNNISVVEVRHPLRRAATLLCSSNEVHPSIIHYLVALPFEIFTEESIKLGVSLWLGVIDENPRAEPRVLVEVEEAWEKTIQRRKGLFNPSFNYVDPMYTKIEQLPSDKSLLLRKQRRAQNMLSPHNHVLQFFESHFSAVRLDNVQNQRLFCRLISSTAVGLTRSSSHPLAREIHFRAILFGLKILQQCTFKNEFLLWKLKDQLLSAALIWFKDAPRWSFGGNRLQIKAEDKILADVSSALESDDVAHSHVQHKSTKAKQELLQVFLENERSRLRVWLFPLEQERRHYPLPASGNKNTVEDPTSLLRPAWMEDPGIAIQLAARFPSPRLKNDVRLLLLSSPEKALDEPSGLEIMFGLALPSDVTYQLKYLLYWASVNPIEALTYFLPAYGNHPFILQYAMRTMESHPIDVRFYLVPQLVQALRYDALGYVERYMLETAKLSQLFAHQVIWNMKANSYKDEDGQVPDPLKPTLDRFMETLISSFSSEEREFYDREFSFFNEVTGVSGKLRPYIKRSKPEKKEKIEEELRKIKVEVGVYLPSNPDGVVVGIDRKSGKPLQSHAKAPYMATFRIRKTRARLIGEETASGTGKQAEQGSSPDSSSSDSDQETYEVWQSGIFKVGDDCRQDMLALQMIAAFRSIFDSVGLDAWVFPYRVTSTAPGCGVIDVLPNSISRDMLGREAVNGLYDYFVSKYGGEESVRFQKARTNFVKSMAAYSVITYLLQFKDRHNGNIMVDDAGHIIHIDFGFCFDIAPGGVRFERAPFKLTSEMIAVMGGTNNVHPHAGGHNPTSSQPYQWFESLAVKAFLASRPHCTKLSHIVSLMLDSGLPCFKPDTLKNFRDRFVLDKSEREAAEYMRELIRKSYMNVSTKGYDQFQLLTNGIPY